MTLTELVDEVYNLTNRPDLSAQTISAVKAATLKLHNTDYYSKDIYETGIEFSKANYIQSVDIYSLIHNFRAIKYIRVAENAADDSGRFIEIITPEEVVDSYNRNRTNVAYMAGRSLEIRSATELKYAYLGCYVRPIISTDNYSSWIAQLHPYAIIYEAARAIFMLIGYTDEANGYNALLNEELKLLKITNVSDIGY